MKNIYLKLLGFTFIICIAVCNCKVDCPHALSIAAGDLEKDARLVIRVDKLKKEEFISPYYHGSSNEIDALIENYCTENDSIEIEVRINKKDTVFFIDPKVISKIYVGHNPRNNYNSFLIKFTYRNSFHGNRINEIIFED